MIRNVILDWSGTLVDDLPAVWEASNHVFEKAGVRALSMEEFRAEFSLPFVDFYRRFTPGLPMEQLEEWFHSRFKEVQDSVVELPHARGFLEFCRQRRLRTFLLSTIRRDHFAAQTARNGFDRFIERPYLEVWDKRDRIHSLLEENELDPAATIFVGDMRHDVETARHGGVWSCAVLTGYTRLEQLRASAPDLIVEHLGELQSMLDQSGLPFARSESATASSVPAVPVGTVGAVIFNDSAEILMIRTQKWSGLWGIPGGKIKFGETATEALGRELREETGLDVRDIRFVLVQDCIRSKEFYREAHFILLNYTCRCSGRPEVVLNEEAQEYQWVTLERAMQMDLNTPTRILLEAVARQAT
jgi:phosphoglycolate phosphatase-like HAD superfamily hydrolase/ADP-ribose pyrophosphatase YjhB (NUDIX family)